MKQDTLVAVDFETFYDTKSGYSLSDMTPYNYVRHQKFDPYMVSVCGEGIEYVGDPLKFDWLQLDGATLCFHNAGFDAVVIERMQELGMIPSIKFTIIDTADMVASFNIKRSLASAIHALYGRTLDKQLRADMDGKTLRDAEAAGFGDALRAYALSDAKETYILARDYLPKWPALERRLSALNREANGRGVRIDREAVEKGVKVLEAVQFEALANMPWVEEGEKPLSGPAFGRFARQSGIESVPASLKKDNPVMLAWVVKYADDYPFIKARMNFASSNPHLNRLRNMLTLADDQDILRFSVKYWGAHTGRASGGSEDEESASFNILNIPSKPVFGVNLRNLLLPHKGYKFAVYDYAQIEARLVLWMAGATEMLTNIRKYGNLYLAFAASVGWIPPFDPSEVDAIKERMPDLYKRAKETVLGGGYGMGWRKFKEQSSRKGINFTEEQAQECINAYRNGAPEVVKFWYAHQALMEESIAHKDPVHEIELPSGRVKPFFDPQYRLDQDLSGKWNRSIVASTTKGFEPKYLWGGKIVENIVQSTARDLMYTAVDAIVAAHPTWLYAWNAYDEVIFEIPDSDVEEAKVEFPRLLCGSTPWADGCPLAVEGKILDHYTK